MMANFQKVVCGSRTVYFAKKHVVKKKKTPGIIYLSR